MFTLTPIMANGQKPTVVSQTHKAIAAGYAYYRKAMLHEDVSKIMGLLTPDFMWQLLDGKVLNRQQTSSELISYFHSIKKIETMTLRLQKVIVKGNTATTLVTEKVTALTREHKRQKRTTTTETYREVWLKTGLGWKIQRMLVLKS